MKSVPSFVPAIRQRLFCLIILPLLTASVSEAQIFERWQQDIVQQYGIIAGIGSSGFTSDSSGYTPSALPYAGGFVSWEFRRQVELQWWVQFTMNGSNHEAPYWRLRYHYLSQGVSLHFRLLGFLQLGAGYGFHIDRGGRKITLSGASSSGLIREQAPGKGSYSQAVGSAMIFMSDNLNLTFNYGIPFTEVPFTRFEVGIRYRINNLTDPAAATVLIKRGVARQHAQDLRDGMLLVRLKSMRSSIVLMEEHGMMEEAEQLRARTQRENEELIRAFGRYNFSKVYFYYDYHTALVMEGSLDSVLLNSQFQAVLPDTHAMTVYTAYLGGYASPDTLYHTRHNPQYLQESGIAPDSTAAYVKYVSHSNRIGGIVITDRELAPLPKPFPVFTPVLNPTFFRSEVRLERAVLRLNNALIKLLYEE
jgi:hypothetical protein